MARTPITLAPDVAKKIVNMQGLSNYDAKIKDFVDAQIAAIPADKYLDQTKTIIVDNFVWSSTTYPGSIDPSLDGNPVLVLAVTDNEGTNTTYSFVSLNKLVDVYTGNEPGDTLKGVEISVDSNRKITGEVKLHTPDSGASEADNLLQIHADGSLYVPKPADFDATVLSDRITDLETVVGEDDTQGLQKSVKDNTTDISNIKTEIGNKADASSSTVASGIYKYVDDSMANVSSQLVYADTTDIDNLFV